MGRRLSGPGQITAQEGRLRQAGGESLILAAIARATHDPDES